jgi:hypothetical protein
VRLSHEVPTQRSRNGGVASQMPERRIVDPSPRVDHGRRADRQQPTDRPASRLRRIDAFPHTRRPLPWMLAAFFVVLFLEPVDSTNLKLSLPVGSNLDRVAIVGLVVGWFWFGGDERAFMRTRRSKLFPAAAAVFVLIAITSLLIGIDRTINLGELGLAGKRMALLGSFLTLGWFTLSALRFEDLRGFCSLIIGLATVMAIGMLIERRTGYNVFYNGVGALFKPIATVAPSPTDIHPAFGTDGRPVVVGPTLHGLAATTMLVVAFPLVLVRALDATSRRPRVINAVLMVLLFSGALATSKRTALVVPVAVIVYVTLYRPRQMLRYLPIGLLCALALAHVASPGSLGEILNPSTTTMSTAHRSEDLTNLMPDLLTHPALGRGYGTLNPDEPAQFRINDDEYLDEVWEVGLVGVAAYLWLILSPIVVAGRAIRARDPTVEPVALATSAGCVAYLVANVLFDAMSYVQAPYMFFFIAALTTIAAAGPEGRSVAPDRADVGAAVPLPALSAG